MVILIENLNYVASAKYDYLEHSLKIQSTYFQY